MLPYNDTEPKREQIRSMFDRIAPSYDMLNRLLSFGVDGRWRAAMAAMVRRSNPRRILDLATGTGFMAVLLAKKIRSAEITGADFSDGMLRIAAKKAAANGVSDRVSFVRAEAEHLPFAEGSFDAVTAAFGVRNFHDIEAALAEMCRVLRRGGEIFILEFSVPENKIFGRLYRLYFHRILPFIGGTISGDRKAYRYLPESVNEFPSADRFLGMMRGSGFQDCRSKAFMTGAVRIYTGKREI